MFSEFKTFIMRGNVLDLAVGVIIGAAFSAIVNSLVNDVLMPPLGLLMGGVDFSDFFVTLKGDAKATLEEAHKAGAVTLNYGLFVNAIIKFIIVAFAIFLLIKQVNRFMPKPKEEPPAPVGPPRAEVLLEEIRDALRARN